MEKLTSGDLKIHAEPIVDMTVEDMFDFNYFNNKSWLRDLIPYYGNPPTVAASIQCAYGQPTIDAGVGQAALLRIKVNGPVTDVGVIITPAP